MQPLLVEATRDGLVESVHEADVAIADPAGRLVAALGQPDRTVYWRSAAKPFQAMPLLHDGAADRFGFGARELTLACASHSAEPMHREVVAGMLERIGASEGDLACGPHPSLSPAVHDAALRAGVTLSPIWSNCSGKHAGMLALASAHGWAWPGYERRGHPVQDRLRAELSRWTGVPAAEVHQAVDGCTAVCFGTPLAAMAGAWARLGVGDGPARTLRDAIIAHPALLAGTGRFDTELLLAGGGLALAKVGADGVYGATVPGAGLGVALKVRSGDMRAATVALAAVLLALPAGGGRAAGELATYLTGQAERPIRNTRDEVTGVLRTSAPVRFSV